MHVSGQLKSRDIEPTTVKLTDLTGEILGRWAPQQWGHREIDLGRGLKEIEIFHGDEEDTPHRDSRTSRAYASRVY